MRNSKLPFILVLLLFIAGIITFIVLLFPSEKEQVIDAAEEFYKLEQQGEASSSWDFLHPDLQKRFSKDQYIIGRSALFKDHLQSESFTYTLGAPNKIDSWQMTHDTTPIPVYEVEARIGLDSAYGKMELVQYLYVTELDDEWKILWDYNF
ncbi:hypothetical protein [Jeotgalibacillus campisalis]|uniref:DUF4878 domain-containing protein n=1 Tax=Jeotgalibacillus campisalis TaxID=220754 RepID=A0A0C2RAW2_9BACL|nr:hypothetical protein [Jeotgalibacillus campisalis]KIL47455.1 hypothetical protein KR50_16220 [Jeotgalibacillus campisalis]